MLVINIPEDLIIDRQEINSLVGFVLNIEGFRIGRIIISFISDEEMLNMNNAFLNHDYYTDVISFGGAKEQWVNGELFISYERAFENSNSIGIEFNRELYRLIVHGVLHLSGWLDSTDKERQLMTQREDYCLSLYYNSST